MSEVHNNKIFKERRVELRRKATQPEKKLWEYLRNGQLGVKFKRQHSIGGYILDFYCSEKKLIIELDGKVHDKKDSKEYDDVRDKFFRELGYRTIRFVNKEVKNDVDGVINKVKSFLNKTKTALSV